LKSSRFFIVLGIATLAGLYLALKPGELATPTQPPPAAGAQGTPAPQPSAAIHQFRIEHGRRVAGPDRIEVRGGDSVTLRITSDAADEVHVHGYDLHAELRPGVPAVLAFKADRSGRFDVELHKSDLQLVTLEVQPR